FEIVAVLGAVNATNRANVQAEFAGVLTGGTLQNNTEIVIIRDTGTTRELVAQLDNIEELVINGSDVPVEDPNNPGQALPSLGVTPIGNFGPTSLALATITINGTTGNDVIDISELLSAHRIVFNTMGGSDTLVGDLRAQDVINVAPGTLLSSYQAVANADGSFTVSNGTNSITFETDGTQFPEITDEAGSDPIQQPPVDPPPSDTATFTGTLFDYILGFNTAGELTVTEISSGLVTVISDVQTIAFADQSLDIAQAEAAANIFRLGDTNDSFSGTGLSEFVSGGAGSDTITARGGNDVVYGDAGDDTINSGGGNDTIVWNAGDGLDTVNGGGGNLDTIIVNGDAAVAETFHIFTAVEAQAAGLTVPTGTEIVITSGNGTPTDADRILLLRNVEELAINETPYGDRSVTDVAGDTIVVHGDFTQTSLALNTITVNGTEGNDTIDITGLDSSHRIVLRSSGGNDKFIGTLRPQDVIELAPGSLLADYVRTENADGSITLSNSTHSVNFTSGADLPLIVTDIGQVLLGDEEVINVDGGTLEPSPTDADPAPAPQTDVPAPSAVALTGTADEDTLVGGAGSDTLASLGGDDTILAGAGDDTVSGGSGNDNIVAGDGNDLVFGDGGDDIIMGDAGNDMLFGGAGNDTITGGTGDDLLNGGKGRDTVSGGDGNDVFVAAAGDGDDVYDGGAGSDTLDYSSFATGVSVDFGTGGFGLVTGDDTGMDTIRYVENAIGGSGNDTFVGNASVNVMTGGVGNDMFVFTTAENADGDRVMDFRAGDKIDLTGIVDNSLAGESFTLADGPSFTAAGQVVFRHEQKEDGVYTIIEGSVDGQSRDFHIELNGRHNLTASDFIGVI
ncbi:MAG: hypothetical protein RLZ98_2371, partial [Pseudomonadota bacterium]